MTTQQTKAHMDNTQKFSGRVENYVKYRPGYPSAIIDILRKETGLNELQVIADVGSGTGILTKLFLDEANTVFAVEPNQEMREAAEDLLSIYEHFHSVNGTAESTGLADRSIDMIVVGQAFHWFDPIPTKTEFRRILKPDGLVVMIWNSMKEESPFWKDYEEFLFQHGTDYREHKSRGLESDEYVEAFYLPNKMTKYVMLNTQNFDLPSFTGRFLSTSHAPLPDHPGYNSAITALQQLFEQHQIGGILRMEYDTKMYVGRIHES